MENPTLTLTILRGFNYSGKSEYARKLCRQSKGSTIIVNRDEIVQTISSYWNPKVETLARDIEEHMIYSALGKDCNVIIDDQNLSDKRCDFLNLIIKNAKDYCVCPNQNIEIKYVNFKKPLYKILLNNIFRKVTFQKSMHPVALIYMYNNYKQKLVNGVK